ncbi:MAG: PilZ domain-containing protein [Fibromonadales bacterium]|nr:PilZ domain-containing protein [Fibromonadales bacterium]
MESLNSSEERLSICLYAFESKYRQEYRKLLGNFNLRVVDIDREEQFRAFFESVRFNGVLIDIPTYIKSSSRTKEFISSLVVIYPSARMSYKEENSSMSLILTGETGLISLQEFLDRCRFFDARKIRRHKRIATSLNLRITVEHEDKPDEILCTSANISEDGMFIITLTDSLPMGTNVKIQILELDIDGFLRGTVIRSLEWGEKPFHPPGFGIRISSADKEILAGYIALINTYYTRAI